MKKNHGTSTLPVMVKIRKISANSVNLWSRGERKAGKVRRIIEDDNEDGL